MVKALAGWRVAVVAGVALSLSLSSPELLAGNKLTDLLRGKQGQQQQQDQQQQQLAVAPPTQAEQQMQNDRKQFHDTVMGGALIGAGVGAAGCLAIQKLRGKSNSNAAKAALGCGLVGGLIGGAMGNETAKKNQQDQKEIRTMQATAADIQRDNQNLQAFIDSSDKVLAEGRSRLDRTHADLAARRISTEQAEQARKREEQNIASMQGTLEQAKKARADYQQQMVANANATPAEKRNIDAQISAMDQKVHRLEANISAYNSALAVSRA